MSRLLRNRPTGTAAKAMQAAAAAAASGIAVSALALTTEPVVYLPAMGAVLLAEAAVATALFHRRLRSFWTAGRRLATAHRRGRSADAQGKALAKMQRIADRLANGFIEEPTAQLRATAEDRSRPASVRRFAAEALRADAKRRANLPAPGTARFDVVIVSNLNLPGGTSASNINEIRLLVESGRTVGLFHHPLYARNAARPVNAKIAELVDGKSVRYIAPGSKVTADLLIMRFPPFATRLREDLPEITARERILVVNQAPMMHYDALGGHHRVWEPAVVHQQLSDWIGDHRWMAAGPAVRGVLVQHHAEEIVGVDLAEEHWYPTLDSGYLRPRDDRAPERPLRIGRHSRDHLAKWPELAADLRSCYPEGPDYEIRVMGGVESVERILGRLPSNWRTYGFDQVPVGDFLTDLDFYVYYPNSTLLEAFGRAPVEAMASGVPTILPPVFKPVFGDGALYAEPENVAGLIDSLADDPEAYRAQQRSGLAEIEERFGFEAHRRRFRALGVDL